MKSFMKHPQIGLIAILAFGVTLFVVSTVMVVAQGFLEPSGAAPQSNVVDFILESALSQARTGKLRVGSNVIPKNAGDPTLDVVGNLYLQGSATFDSVSSNDTSLFVNNALGKSYVATGTVTENGKYSANSNSGIALTGQSSSKYGIDVTSGVGGSTSNPRSVVYGETIQSGSIGVSAGVWGHATGNGAGVNGINDTCTSDPASWISCGYAAKFIGKVIVANGVYKGDARDVYRSWSLRDPSITSGGTGIGFKTFDFPSTQYGDFDNGDPKKAQVDNALGSDANFLSMSVLVGGLPYDPRNAALATTDPKYLAVTFDESNQQLVVKKSTLNPNGTTALPITVHVFYHQKLTAVITEGETVLAFKNVLIGSSTQYAFSAKIAGKLGTLGTTDFNWALYTNPSATTACLPAEDCGTIVSGFATGPTTAYVPPMNNNTVPAARVVYLKATWTSDSSVTAILPIPLYYLEISTYTPAAKIGYGVELTPGVFTNPYTFAADVIPPGASPAPSIEWSVAAATETGSINSSSGAYTVPAIKTSGNGWTETVEATISVTGATFTKQHTFDLVPHVIVNATNPVTQQLGTGQTVELEGIAQNIPIAIRHNLVWSKETPSETGEALSLLVTTNTAQKTVYTAPTNLLSDRVRTVTATWYRNNDSTQTVAASTGQIKLYPGTLVGPSISRTTNSTGTHNVGVQGFKNERRMYSICTSASCTTQTTITYPVGAAQPITGVTCGSLSYTAPSTQDSCDIDATPCILNSTFSYTSAGSACTQTLYVKMLGDQREVGTLTVTTTGGGGCVCTKGTEPCCTPPPDGQGF